MERVHLISLGCPKNLTDSELMLGTLVQAGFDLTTDPDSADVLIVNTCAFIDSAKKESLDAILQASETKQRRSGRRLVVSGCLAQRYGAQLREELPEIDIFVGTGNFLDLPELLKRTAPPENRTLPYTGAAHLLPDAAAPRVRLNDFFTAYLKISEGCNHKCAFCIIPKIRGLHESRPLSDIVAEAHALAASGVRELNLIAQDLTAYGRDHNPSASLADLLLKLNAIEGISWIRLLYCYPNFVTDELLDAVASLPKVVKYIDMPLQHADDGILRAMKRERSASALSRILDRVRRRVPEVTLRTSFIVGFPGETDEAFARLTGFVEREQFDRVGVFTYSQEENTAAATMPAQVPSRLKRARRRRLMEIQAGISMRKNQALLGKNLEVMVEGQLAGSATRLRGRTSAQAPDIDGMVILHGDALPGEIVHARIDQARTYDLLGEITGASA